jgi:hypothetical protein
LHLIYNFPAEQGFSFRTGILDLFIFAVASQFFAKDFVGAMVGLATVLLIRFVP